MIICGREIRIVRSKRKSIALEIAKDLAVTVRVPLRFPEEEIERVVKKHERWICEATARKAEAERRYPEPSQEEVKLLRQRAMEIIPQKVEYWSAVTGLCPTAVKITGAKTRFGSCSSKNSVCFSYLLMRYPEEAIDYVVLHELVHIRHHNHSRDFYSTVAFYMPDYERREALLRV